MLPTVAGTLANGLVLHLMCENNCPSFLLVRVSKGHPIGYLTVKEFERRRRCAFCHEKKGVVRVVPPTSPAGFPVTR